MSEIEIDIEKKLKSSDAAERKEALEKLLTEKMSDDLIDLVSTLFSDPDKGVRDAVSLLFTAETYPQVPEKIVRYIFSEDISIRNMAGEVLLKNGENSVNALMNELGKGNNDDEKFIVDLLGLIGDKRASEKIIQILNDNDDENVILACIEALGNVKCEEVVNYLVEMFGRSELLTPTIIEALGKIGNSEAVDHFLNIYSEQDELTKFTIIESLGKVGDQNSLTFLLNELQKGNESLLGPIVKSAYQLIEKLGFEIEFNETMKKTILKGIESDDIEVVKAVVYMLYNYEDKEILKAFISIFGNDPELDDMLKQKFFNNYEIVYSYLPKMISRQGNNQKKLLMLVKDLFELKIENGIETLTEIDYMELLNALSLQIDNPDEEIRITCAELLFKIDPKDALLFVDKLVDDDNLWNRMKLIELLYYVDEPEAIKLIEKLKDDPEEMVRERAESLLQEKNL